MQPDCCELFTPFGREFCKVHPFGGQVNENELKSRILTENDGCNREVLYTSLQLYKLLPFPTN